MNAFLGLVDRRRVSTHGDHDHHHYHHHHYCSDCQPPGRHTHRRMIVAIVLLCGAAALFALFSGAMDGVSQMEGAFPSFSALTEAAAWNRFFTGLQHVGALVLLMAGIVWIVRCLRRRSVKK